MSRLYDILDSILGEILQDTDWQNLGGGIKYRVFRGVCYVSIDGASVQAGATRILATLPEGARPKMNVNIFFRSGYDLAQCWTGTHGEIRCIVQQNTTAGAGFCCWPV